jgi:hypothetical protein
MPWAEAMIGPPVCGGLLMPIVTIRFCVNGSQLDEIEVEAPKGASLKNLIQHAKHCLRGSFAKPRRRAGRANSELSDQLSSLGSGKFGSGSGDSGFPE